MKRFAAVLTAVGVSLSLSVSAEALPKLGVLDFQANGASEQLASAASGVTANELDRLGLFKVITSEAIRSLVALERQRQLMGCNDQSCMGELGDVLGVEWSVTGKVSRIEGKGGMPTTFTLELALLNVKQARRESSAVQTAQSEAELMGKISPTVTRLMAKILEGKAGQLVVAATEAGAVVKVDDTVVGTTPLGRLTFPGGPHFLVVEKAGFVAWQRQIRIAPAELTEEAVTLIPSPDYVREYEAKHGRMRLAAWISTGVAAAGAATFGALQWHSNQLYGNPDTAGTFAYHQAKLRAGIEVEGEVNHRTEALRLRSAIDGNNTFSYVAAGLGGAAMVSAAWFWIAGEDPGRYAKYRETPKLSLTPTAGGAFGTVAFEF